MGGHRDRVTRDGRSGAPVTALTVWTFGSSEGADNAWRTLQHLSRENRCALHGAAVVEWNQGADKPKTRQLTHAGSAEALGGAFWGMLFGLIFLVPLLGAAVGAPSDAVSGALADAGIDDRFIVSVRNQVTAGASALFAMISTTVLDEVRDALGVDRPDVIFTYLDHEQERALVEVFGDDDRLDQSGRS